MGSKTEDSNYAELKTRTTLAGLRQALVTLSKENTQRLLQSATERQQSRRQDAAAILARLEELNPSVASQFQPKQDSLDSLTLRMVLPSDVLPENNLDTIDVPSYLIVSYCWHYPEWPLSPAAKPIAKGWEISKPMVDAIMDLRQTPNEGVWLDKLCINQGDDEEKQGHIASMDIIYQSARRLIILLEDVQLTKEETLAGTTYAKFYQDLCDEVKERNLEGEEKSDFIDEYFPRREKETRAAGNDHLIDGIRDFAINILDGRWYTRAWCAHESRVTPHQKINNPLFLCFDHNGQVLNFEFRFIFYLSIYLHMQEEEQSPEDLVTTSVTRYDALNSPHPRTLAEYRYRIQRLNVAYEPDASTMQHVVYILMFGCLKKGDLMSIALNTSGIPLSFTGQDQISELGDVLWIYSLLVLASGDLVPLITTDVAQAVRLKITDPNNPAGRKLISWVPAVNQGITDDKIPLLAPGTITAVACDYIELDLLLFKARPTNASTEALSLAAKLIEEHNLTALDRQILDESDRETRRRQGILSAAVRTASREGAGPLAVFHKIWLSHALDCGLDWMLRFPDTMKKDTSDKDWIHGQMGIISDIRFKSTAESFLKHFLGNLPAQDFETKSTEYLPGLIRSFTTIFDPRLPYFTASPRRLPLGGPENGNYAFVSSTSNIAYIAVPVCIAHLPAHYPRAWNIEPFDPLHEPEILPDDHLPDLSKVYPRDAEAEDVFPVMTSDYDDRRKPQDDNRGTWRLRRRGDIFGFSGFTGVGTSSGRLDVTLQEDYFQGSEEVIYLKRQRVYGAEDYDWGAIGAAGKNLKLEPEAELETELKTEDINTPKTEEDGLLS